MLYQLTLTGLRAVEQQIMLGSGDLVVLLAVVATVQGELLYRMARNFRGLKFSRISLD